MGRSGFPARAISAAPLVLLLVAFAPHAGASEGQQTFRILTHGDLVAVPAAVAVGCHDDSPLSPATCGLLRGALGYDGVTGAFWDASAHVGHAFYCTATSALTPDTVSISVGFDGDGDTFVDDGAEYPGGTYRPLDETGIMPGGVTVPGTGIPFVDDEVGLPLTLNPELRDGYVLTQLLRGGAWSPEVGGPVAGELAFLFNHLGEDVTVDCTF